jgi:hypothetical protein
MLVNDAETVLSQRWTAITDPENAALAVSTFERIRVAVGSNNKYMHSCLRNYA